MAANIFQSGGVNNNWNTIGNWSLGAVPTASDGNVATFDATSPNCTVNISAVCNGINFTGYTNTITMTNGIASSGSVTLGSSMIIVGSGGLTINSSGTLTTNGITWPNDLVVGGTSTVVTLAATSSIAGGLTFSGTSPGINLYSIYVGGSLFVGAASGGTSTIIMNGTGSVNGNGLTLQHNLTFNTSGTITFINFAFANKTLTYTSGTIITTGSSLNLVIGAGASVLNTSGMNGSTTNKWYNIGMGGNTGVNNTYLSSDLYCSNTLTMGAAGGNTCSVNNLGGLYNIYAGGNVTLSGPARGTSNLVMNGTGTLSTSTNVLKNNLVFNSPTGVITLSGTVSYDTGTVSYTAGTVSVGSSVLNVVSNAGFDTSGMTWSKIQITGSTITLGSDLKCSGLLTVYSNPTFSGAYNLKTSGGLSGTGTLVMSSGTLVIAGGTESSGLTVTGNKTYDGNVVVSGTIGWRGGTLLHSSGTVTTTGSTLQLNNSTGSINCSGITWNNVTLINSFAGTLLNDFNISGNLDLASSNSISTTWTGLYNINVGGDLTISGTGNTCTSTTSTVVMNGTGTITTATSSQFKINLKINTTGSTIFSGIVGFGAQTLTYITAYSLSTTGSTLNILTTGATLSTSGMTWNNITLASGITLNQGSNNALSGTLTTAGTTTINGSSLSGSNWIFDTTTLAGSSNITFTGNALLSDTISGTDLTINKTNTLTFAGTLIWSVPTFTYTSGNITTTGNVMVITDNRTFNGSTTTWGGWNISGTPTITLNTLQAFNGSLTLGSSATFSGTNGFNTSFLNSSVPGSTIVLSSGVTYSVVNSFISSGIIGNVILYKSSVPSTRAILKVNVGSAESVLYTNATDIDSSAGQTVLYVNGVTSNTLNWVSNTSINVTSVYVN